MKKSLFTLIGLMVAAFIVTFFISAAEIVFFGEQNIVVFANVGTTTWIVPEGVTSVDVLVVAGGGGSGGAGSSGYYSGGGGGGGVIYESSFPVTPASSISVTVGSGGVAGVQTGDVGYSGGNGGNSVFGSLMAIGGGGGGGNYSSGRAGLAGGSGGGGSLYDGTGGAGTLGQGNAGGNVYGHCGSGGGGAGSPGGDGLGTARVDGHGGSGGHGLAYSISGSVIYYGGGGAARGITSNGEALLGATPVDTEGLPNTGAGGGGTHRVAGKAGGSGVVIISYGKPKATASSLQKGLVGHWTLDEDRYNSSNNRVTDNTPYENHGINYGATFVADRHGQEGGAMSFNGVNNYVLIGDSDILGLGTGAITVSHWINFSNNTGWKLLFFAGATGGGKGYGTSINNNRFEYEVYGDSGGRQNTKVDIGLVNNQWNHVVAIFDTINLEKKVYLNGELKHQKTLAETTFVPTATKTNLGSYNATSYYYNGLMDDVRVYNRALSEQEIKQLYESYEPKIVADSLQKGLIFDMPLTSTYTKTETAGAQIMTDRTPYSNVGKNYGGAVSSEGTSFNGSSQYIGNIDTDNPELFEPVAITVSSWINMDTDASTARHIWLTKWLGFSSEVAANTRIPYFRLNGPGDIVSNTALTLGQWQHFVGTYDPAIGGRVYLDGVLVGSKGPSGQITYSRSHPLNIGRYYGGIYFKGKISHARIYNRALSAEEVKSLYDRGRR